jgi:hypothetical protein
MTIRDRISDPVVAIFVGNPVRSLAIGTTMLWLGAHYMGWWTAVLVVVGAAWELMAYPGRLP